MAGGERRVWLAVLLAALAAACSDGAYRLGDIVTGGGGEPSGGITNSDDGDAPTPVAGELNRPAAASGGLCREGADFELIDDMEDEDGSTELSEGRAGLWFAFNDQTGTQVPPVAAELFPMDPIKPPRDESFFAAHTYGSGFTNWGAGIGFELLVQQAYDASAYAGIAFFARVAKGANSVLRFDVTDRNTSPYGGVCDLEAGLCHNNFGANLELETRWRYFSFGWDELEQHEDWSGADSPLPHIEESALYGVRFQTAQGKDFDFWIDDIAFLCRER